MKLGLLRDSELIGSDGCHGAHAGHGSLEAMGALRVGVQMQPQHADYDAMRRAWVEAEELGVDAVFTWDHFYPLYGDPDGKHFESLALQAALAEATERVQI